eukprot:s3992_g3.t2
MLVAFTVMVVLMVLVMLTITMTSVMVYYGALGCLNKGALSATVRVFVAMILYELQLDIGGGSGRSIHHEFVKDAYKRVGMKDQALAALTHILVRCTDYRYDVLEVFSVGEVFLAQNVRPSFLGEMLSLVLQSTVKAQAFRMKDSITPYDQQVLHLEIVEMQSHTSNNFSIYLLVATNFKVFLLEPNPEKPAYAAEIGERWDPNWDPLILAVEWQGAGKRLSDAGESSPGSGQEIQYEVYLFHLADRRDVMADCLRAYAASKDVKGEGPPVLTDPSFRNIVIGQTKEEQMLAATVTTLGPTPRVGLFAAEQKADHRPRLFVLTKASVLEFAINSSKQSCRKLPEIQQLEGLQEPFSTSDVSRAVEPFLPSWRSAPQKATVVLRHMAGRQPDLALAVLRSMVLGLVEANTVHWNALIFKATQDWDWERGYALVEEEIAAGLSCETNSYNSILSAAVRSERWPWAIAMLSQRFEVGVSADTVSFNIFADSIAKLGEWQPVLCILQDLFSEQLLPDAVTYSTCICASKSEEHWPLACHLLQRMQSLDVAPDMANFGTAVNACGSITKWKSAAQLLREGAARTLRVNAASFNAAISSLRSGEWQRAAGYVETMRKCQMGPDAITLSSSVTACDKGAWQVALVHFVDFSWRKVCPNAFVGNALLSCCSSDSQWQAGLQMLMLFQQLHIASEVSFNIAFSMFDRSGAWQAAVALIPFVSQLHSSPSVSQLNSVMSCLAKVQQWQQAAHLLQHLHSGSIEATTATYCQLVEACKNDAAAALQWFQEMLKVKLELDATACLAVLSISAKHTWEIGVFALQSLREKDDLIAHNVAVSTLGKHARWQLGAHCAERVSSQGLRANIITFSSLLSSVEPGRWHVALGILSALPCRSLRPNDFTRSAAIASLGPGRQWRSITALLLEMSKEALELNQVCSGAALRGFERQSLWQRSLWLLRNHRARELDPVSCSSTLSACSEVALWSSWHPPSELDPAIFDDFLPDDLNEVEGEGEELEAEEVFPPPSDEEMALRHLDRLSAASGKVRPPPQTGPGRPVLTLAKTYKLPASEIHFESRSEADLTLHFSSGAFCIRFFTDSSREVWRRGLAYTLIRGEKGWERQR